ncbi:MAG: helix-hairpin-helix domain-containing protein [Myxococcota bacterium]
MAKERVHFEIGGIEVSVSSPRKVYFPEAGLTKLDVIEYWRSVAPAALRAAGGRPLVLKRYVNGAAAEAFYQKRAPPSRPDWVDTVTLRFPSGRKADEVVLHNEAQLVWAANLGCLELHVHPVRAGDLDHPDELRIDLDPVPGIEWGQIREVGFRTKEVLDELGLIGWPKTSGSRGLHIYCRIHPRWSFTEVRRAALAIAREVERRSPPGVATSRWWKEERQGVFLDYNQNAKDRTMAAAWSVRPTPDARVSMPVDWTELENVDPVQFNLRTAPLRLVERGDPHEGMGEAVGDLGKALDLVAAHEAEGLGDAAWPPHFIKGADEPVRAQPSRRRPSRPLVEIGRAKAREDALAGLERWKARHPEVVPHLLPADVLVDRMRGRHTEWTRIRVNLQHVPSELRPAQEPLDPNYDAGSEWAGRAGEGPELPRLPGLGPAKARALHEALGVTSVEELEEAAQNGRIRTVKGFGPKTETSILEAISRQRERAGWWLSFEARRMAERLLGALRSVADRAEVTGALRRGVETVDRLELLAAGAPPETLRACLAELPEARSTKILPGSGGDAQRVQVELHDGPPAEVLCVAPEAFSVAWHWSTAGEGHRDGLVARAQTRGLTLSVAGLSCGSDPIVVASEEELAEKLEIAWIPPELRESAETLDLEADEVASLVEVGDLAGMVHCHTTWSDGKSSIEEMARAAEARGFAYLTITDHSSSAYYANGLTADELRRQWDEIDAVQEKVSIRILKGTESDILVDGALDFPSAVLEGLDVVIASVHSRFKLTAEDMTARLVRTMKLPLFKIWGHPLGRLLLRRDPVQIDLGAVLDALAEAPGAIEINADPHRLDLPPEPIREARVRKIPFVISADAHSIPGMEVLPYGVTVARRAGLTKGEVLNAQGADAFVDAVRPQRS